MPPVPYFDLGAQYAALRDEVLGAVDRVCASSAFILGEEVEQFEAEFSEFCGVRHCVALNSGTSALHLLLLAAGVGPGDEVITSANSFIATAEAIAYTGATPVFADVDPATGNLDPAAAEAAITPRTRAVMPVHLYGRPADLDAFTALAERHGIALIEDACQAHGAAYGGRRVGGFGLGGAFSFYPAKNLGAYGEGGALTTQDEEVAELARSLRDHGQSSRYHHDRLGFNYRMDGIQGAVLRIKLAHLEEWNATRRTLAARYREQLAGLPLDLPEDAEGDECAYHLFAVWVDGRDALRDALAARDIGTGLHYPVPIHLQQPFRDKTSGVGSLPLTERACERTLSLPLYPELELEQVDQVAAALYDISESPELLGV